MMVRHRFRIDRFTEDPVRPRLPVRIIVPGYTSVDTFALLDSGATRSYVPLSMLEAAGVPMGELEPMDPIEDWWTDGQIARWYCQRGRIELGPGADALGGWPIRADGFEVQPGRGHEWGQHPLLGITDFFAQFRVTFDYVSSPTRIELVQEIERPDQPAIEEAPHERTAVG